jgi:anti-sigma regulatory factor (Ser/Thr protein kinase)
MCTVSAPVRLAMPMDDHAPGHARLFLAEAHCPAHNTSVLDEATLLVSELVTNALLHGAPPITLEIECDGSAGMQIRVSDGSGAQPAIGHPGVDDEHGRGVALVDMLSDAWGVDPTPNGKAVWFRLRAGGTKR